MGTGVEVGLGSAAIVGVLAYGLAALPWSASEVSSTDAGLRQVGRWLLARPAVWWAGVAPGVRWAWGLAAPALGGRQVVVSAIVETAASPFPAGVEVGDEQQKAA